MRFATFAGAIIFAAWFGRALYVVISRHPNSQPFDIDRACESTTFSCGVVSGTLGFLLTLGLAYLLFLFRLVRVRTPYVRKARETPAEVVQTADSAMGAVVGRDALCHMLITNLSDRATRRPQVVVGGLGTGKTTLLVQLTKLLAERGAVPVPISLREAQDNLDFRTQAFQRFLRATSGAVTDDANAVRIWRQLCDEDKVVVLADGLEEAVIQARGAMADYSIRVAILQASEQGLPLIVTSRPHGPLRGMPASIVELEPLSEEAILESSVDRHLGWIVETADLAEAPIYLKIARQLYQTGGLDHLVLRNGGLRDVRLVDRAEFRLRLLDAWIEAVKGGLFATEVALDSAERAAIVIQLSVLACIGLQRDLLLVTFDDFEELVRRGHPMIEEAGAKLAGLRSGFDIQWAAVRGAQLGLVEARGNGVRFPNPLLQAYLGSRLIGAAMEDPEYRSRALDWPGREFLTALVMDSRARVQGSRPIESAGSAAVAEPPRAKDRQLPLARDWRLQNLLVEATRHRHDAKVLDLYAAALEIDSVDQAPVHSHIAKQLTMVWPEVHAAEPRALEEAKLNLVYRFGEATRTIAERYPQGKQDRRRKREQPNDTICPAYKQLYRISYLESSNSIRVAGAQEIGAGGDVAFDTLEGLLGPGDDGDWADGREAPLARDEITGKPGAQPQLDNGASREDNAEREMILRAWLAPLLAGSARHRVGDARDNLERWVGFVDEPDLARADAHLRQPLEVALAQGFKYAANRRRSHTQAPMDARFYLAEQAVEMLKRSRFWFSQLTLLHALCMWSLPDSEVANPAERRRTDHSTVVGHWSAMMRSGKHPFIIEAQRLVTWALETRLPERFIWIDERDVAAKIGSYPSHLTSTRRRNLWIPPSSGWTVLHPRAQKLLAEVLLLLNMAERGEQATGYSQRLRRIDRNYLPLCFTHDPRPLEPERTVADRYTMPGTNCIDGCDFHLCPYPPKHEAISRTELSESFCLRQQKLAKSHLALGLTALWQQTSQANLSQFWEQMVHRARG